MIGVAPPTDAASKGSSARARYASVLVQAAGSWRASGAPELEGKFKVPRQPACPTSHTLKSSPAAITASAALIRSKSLRRPVHRRAASLWPGSTRVLNLCERAPTKAPQRSSSTNRKLKPAIRQGITAEGLATARGAFPRRAWLLPGLNGRHARTSGPTICLTTWAPTVLSRALTGGGVFNGVTAATHARCFAVTKANRGYRHAPYDEGAASARGREIWARQRRRSRSMACRRTHFAARRAM
jgi:hypothetical protein